MRTGVTLSPLVLLRDHLEDPCRCARLAHPHRPSRAPGCCLKADLEDEAGEGHEEDTEASDTAADRAATPREHQARASGWTEGGGSESEVKKPREVPAKTPGCFACVRLLVPSVMCLSVGSPKKKHQRNTQNSLEGLALFTVEGFTRNQDSSQTSVQATLFQAALVRGLDPREPVVGPACLGWFLSTLMYLTWVLAWNHGATNGVWPV